MDPMVMPRIQDEHALARTRMSCRKGSGKTIMTTEPAWPDEPVELSQNDSVGFRIRLVDCVAMLSTC